MSLDNEFLDFIKAMPRPDASIDFDACLSSGDRGLVMFYDGAEIDALVPEHMHGGQWGSY
jgi:hypothetical protein